MPQYPQRFWLAALIVAWAVDFLFWDKPAGISYLIIVVLALAAGFWLASLEKTRPARLSYVLSGLVLLLAGVTVLRSEDFSRWLNGLLAIFGLGLLALTLRSGSWVHFKMLDYLAGGFDLIIAALSRAIGMAVFPKSAEGDAGKAVWKQAAPVLRGLFLAVPVVLVLGSLLASADLVFADQLQELFKIFDLSHLPEYIFRLFYILVLTYALAGIFVFAVLPRPVFGGAARPSTSKEAEAAQDESAPPAGDEPAAAVPGGLPKSLESQPAEGTADPWRFLGATETFIVLGAVDVLFAFFVAVQFRYFFGGRANIHLAGYTYSEYARRGFFELVMVAVLSLMLYLTLNRLIRRTRPAHEAVFTVLSVLLVGLVLVILVSAFQRLLLYEAAYGFTSLRTYTHIFIPWLGLLLAATIFLQISRREMYFGALLLLTVFGFALTFGLINVDGFIADQNIRRARLGKDLDAAYLMSLSDDALPVIAREYQRPGQEAGVQDTLGRVLACRVYAIGMEKPRPWQSYHLGQSLARQSLAGVDLGDYPIQVGNSGATILVDGKPVNCLAARSWD